MMIYEVTSSLPQFKSMSFSAGLNVVLATKSYGATEKQSRNGADKTSLVETIHFLLGANADPKGLFRSQTLKDFDFSMKFDLFDTPATVTRRGSTYDKIRVSADALSWKGITFADVESDIQSLQNDQWKLLLGQAFFDLDPSDVKDYKATFRQLFPYFARREKSGGFLDPLQHTRSQSTYLKQVAVSRLLGLDERIAQDFESLREKTKLIKVLKKATKGTLNRFIHSAASRRRDLSIARGRATKLREKITSFTVVAEYENLEKEANSITQKISTLNDQNTIDLEHIRIIEEAVEEEMPPQVDYVEKVFKDANVIFENLVNKHYDDVHKFYIAVIQNRNHHLTAELTDAKERVEKRNRERERLDLRRRQIMDILSSGGALEHFNRLSEELARCEATVETLEQQLNDAEMLERTQTELKSERSKLHLALQADHHERGNIIEQAIQFFQDLSNSLYEEAGHLTISATSEGPKFTFDISKQESKGINNMQILCFDLMLMKIVTKRRLGPSVLIHDSHLFDGVDERQVAQALQLGARQAEENGYQYIVTLNSDAVPSDGFDRGFQIQDYFQDVRLTDAEESGGLFGINFG